jgi:hypothetical protein
MATWLHDPETLDSLADGPAGVARDWANLRLALRAPERMRHLPTRPWDVTIAVAIGARGAVDGVLERVRARAPGAVDALDAVFALGGLPEESGRWVEAVRALFPSVADADRATVARALVDLGALDAEALSTTARGQGADVRTMVPGLVLRWAEAEGMALDPVAVDVAGPLAADPDGLGWALTVVGLPHLRVPDDLDAATILGARLAGAEDPALGGRGSLRSRARRRVQDLLDGRTGPAEALLRALAVHDGPNPAELCALAAWCASRPDPSDARTAALRGAGEDRRLLASARRLRDGSGLAEPLCDPTLKSTPLVGIATATGDESLWDPLLVRAELSRDTDASAELGTWVVAAADPDRVVGWLEDPETRDLGLSGARYAPTVEVLEALLGLHVPLDPGARALYGWALAEMADPAAFAVVEGLEGEALGYARELMGR